MYSVLHGFYVSDTNKENFVESLENLNNPGIYSKGETTISTTI